mmetsp:Transcript_39207/g.44920  ORF Transcript_39207/g.44920 Transcript_39207/m.44920 type:complete len:158 (-) Transcript_39207:193-666(-)
MNMSMRQPTGIAYTRALRRRMLSQNKDSNGEDRHRKRYAISPQFQNNNMKFSGVKSRRVFSPEMKAFQDPNSLSVVAPPKTIDVRECLNSTYAKDTRKEFEDILEKHGGNYNPGYGYQNIFESQEHKSGWSRFLGVIKDNPTNENTLRTVKQMKGQK